jgi:hypothetical protein
MDALKTTLKGLGYIGLGLFALIASGALGYYWWLEDRQVAKDREERRFQILVDRVAYLEQELRKMDGDHLALEQRVEEIEQSTSSVV